MPSSVVYFGGMTAEGPTDKVVEYQNLKWTLLGNLASPRVDHQAVKMENMIYIFGGSSKT